MAKDARAEPRAFKAASCGSSAASTAAGACASRRGRDCGRRRIACARRCSTGSARICRGSPVLDLFAGSGALGFEAASRGAAQVTMVEKDRVALVELERGRSLLGALQVTIVAGDAHAFLASGRPAPATRFDVVFLDPPFRQNALPALLAELPARLQPSARVYLESDVPVPASRAVDRAEARARGAGKLPITAMGRT
jgi:16S rRNA (guanine(966)-N(2))-methyltransferase RsmD